MIDSDLPIRTIDATIIDILCIMMGFHYYLFWARAENQIGSEQNLKEKKSDN